MDHLFKDENYAKNEKLKNKFIRVQGAASEI
jgi:hypothetical protein